MLPTTGLGAIVCTPVTCSAQSLVDALRPIASNLTGNGIVQPSSTATYAYDATYTPSCLPGFQPVSGTSVAYQCKALDTWLAGSLSCIPRLCGSPMVSRDCALLVVVPPVYLGYMLALAFECISTCGMNR